MMGNSLDPLIVQRLGIFCAGPEPELDIRCGTCAGWHWLTGLAPHPMRGRCTHATRGVPRGLLGAYDGRDCIDWQTDNPL